MKKLLSLALALILVLSMSTVAFAEEQDLTGHLDTQPVVPKNYVVNNGTAPAETFTYSFAGVSYKNGDGEVVENASIPAIADVTIAFDAISATTNKNVQVAIDADDYALGVYTYKVTEAKGDTAGVTYSAEELYLVLTILRDEDSQKHYVAAMHYQSATGTDKTSGFTNQYDAGSLAVTKEIKGNMADMSKKFEFTVVFTPAEDTKFDTTVQIVDDKATTERAYTAIANQDGTYTVKFELGDGETATFTNIPAGTTYAVTEAEENYTSDGGVFADTSKTIAADDNDTVVFTNTLTSEVDTGISMDSLPYVLMLAVAFVGLAVIVSKKRMARDF